MKIIPTRFKEVLLFELDVHPDNRGYFMELWQAARYAEAGIKDTFAQDNLSFSKRGVLRGLHFQNPGAQGKLVICLIGEVYHVAVDVREGSETFGQHFGVRLGQSVLWQLYAPPGFAHGFVVLSDWALFTYKCSTPYRPDAERCILWNDPDIGISWPVKDPVISLKDSRGIRLKDIPKEWLRL